MAVFYKVIRDTNDPKLESMPSIEDNTPDSPNNAALKAAIPNLLVTENHSMQTHCVNLNYFVNSSLFVLLLFYNLFLGTGYLNATRTNGS